MAAAKREAKIRRSVEVQKPPAEDELRAIVDNAPVFLWSDLPDGYCDFLNQRWLKYFNLSLQEAQGAGWATVLHPDDAAHHLESWQKAVSMGLPFETEARFRRPDGEYRWFLSRADPLRDRTGRIVKWYGTNIDIENLKRAEGRLRQSEANLAEAQRLSKTGSWAINPAMTQIFYWSDECYRIWGFDPAQGLPSRETVWRRIHPSDRERMYKETEEALQQKTDYKIDFRIVLPDGSIKYLETIGHHHFSADGELVQVVGTNVDITERKRAEERLRRSEAYLAEAQRLSHTGAFGVVEDLSDNKVFPRRIVYWSEENYRIWGFDPLLGLPNYEATWQRVHPDDRDAVREEVQEALRQKRDYAIRMRIVLPDGTIKHLEATGHHVFSATGDLVEVLGTHVDLTERKRAEEALREREAKIRRLVDSNIIGIFIWDFDGRILEANEAFLHIVGYDHEDLVAGRIRWTDLTPPEWRDRDAQLIQEHKATGALQPFEKEYFRKDGSRVPVLIGVATFEEGGNQGVAFVLDLTERKRAEEALRDREEALRRSEAWLALAQKLSQTGNWVLSPRKRFLYWSDGCYRIWGFDPLQGVPSRESMWERIHPDDRDRVWGQVQEAEREKRGFYTEFRILLPDGTVKYLEANTHHEFSPTGALVEAVSTQIDVTERKRAEMVGQRLAAIVDSSEDAIISKDLNGIIESWNGAAERLFGYQASEVIGKSILIIIPPNRHDEELEILERIRCGGRIKPYETVRMHKDGSLLDISLTLSPLRDAAGRIIGAAKIARDITERKRTLARLDQLQLDFARMNRVSMMGELAASLSHEIAQPIASARNNARAAQNYLDKKPKHLDAVKEALDCVVADADRAGDIVERIRDYIKKAPPRKDPCDLDVAIDEVIELARSSIIRNGVSVQRFADGLLPVHGDRVQLQQVVLNLILNAVEAMGSMETGARELSIKTEQDQTGVLVAVTDSGPGIHPEHLDRVFDAFYTTKSSGVGMGLSICRSIIEAHGGRLWAEANEPRGAVFRFTLPGR